MGVGMDVRRLECGERFDRLRFLDLLGRNQASQGAGHLEVEQMRDVDVLIHKPLDHRLVTNDAVDEGGCVEDDQSGRPARTASAA